MVLKPAGELQNPPARTILTNLKLCGAPGELRQEVRELFQVKKVDFSVHIS